MKLWIREVCCTHTHTHTHICTHKYTNMFACVYRKLHPIPVFLPGKYHGHKSLVDYHPWGLKELDITEWAHTYMYTCTCMLMYICTCMLMYMCIHASACCFYMLLRQESLTRSGVAIIVNKSLKCSTWMQSQKWQNDLFSFPRQTIQYHSNPSLCPNE